MYEPAGGGGLVAPTMRALAGFELYRPSTVADAVSAMGLDPGGTAYLAGGTDFVARVREGEMPRAVVHLGAVAELRAASVTAGTLRVGAGLSHHDGANTAVVRVGLPGLAAAWGGIANVRIRFRGTIGGNLMARRTRYELPILLTALAARVRCRTPEGAETVLGVDAVHRGDVPAGALLTTIEVPGIGETWFDYERSMRPTVTVATAVRATPDGTRVRIAVGSEYQPVQVAELSGMEDPAGLDGREVADALAARLPDAVGDVLTSAGYRRRVTAVLVSRQLARYRERR